MTMRGWKPPASGRTENANAIALLYGGSALAGGEGPRYGGVTRRRMTE